MNLTGRTLEGRYLVQRALKSGGMGAVYEAQDARLGNSRCAVKEMLEIGSDDEELFRRKFQEEAHILSVLEHPGIPRVRDFFCLEKRCYIVMDLVNGTNLDQELHDRMELVGEPFAPEQLVEDVLQVLDILVYLHGLHPPVIHRDIKPANLIREHPGKRIRLVDFGLARTVLDAKSQTMVGTMAFCPMEQMQGHAGPRSDLYSLGVTMHQLLTGRPPGFLQLEPLEKFELPPMLKRVVEKSTRLQPEERYSCAEEMRHALLEFRQASQTPLPSVQVPEPMPPQPTSAPSAAVQEARAIPDAVSHASSARVPGRAGALKSAALLAVPLSGLLLAGLWPGKNPPLPAPTFSTSPSPAMAELGHTPTATPAPVAVHHPDPVARPSRLPIRSTPRSRPLVVKRPQPPSERSPAPSASPSERPRVLDSPRYPQASSKKTPQADSKIPQSSSHSGPVPVTSPLPPGRIEKMVRSPLGDMTTHFTEGFNLTEWEAVGPFGAQRLVATGVPGNPIHYIVIQVEDYPDSDSARILAHVREEAQTNGATICSERALGGTRGLKMELKKDRAPARCLAIVDTVRGDRAWSYSWLAVFRENRGDVREHSSDSRSWSQLLQRIKVGGKPLPSDWSE